MSMSNSDNAGSVADLEAELRSQRDAIVAALKAFGRDNIGEVPDGPVGELEQLLATVDAALTGASTVGADELARLAASLPQIVAQVQSGIAASKGAAALETAVRMTEITATQISHMDVGDMASRFTAREFAAMSEEQLDAVAARVDRHFADSRASELAAHDRILQSGSDSELETYRAVRARLQADLAAAQARGDRQAAARAQWLLSVNSVQGAIEAEMSPDFVDERRTQAERDEQAFRLLVREQAAREAAVAADQQGLSGEARTAFIAGAVEQAETREMQAAYAERDQLLAAHQGTAASDVQGTKMALERAEEEAVQGSIHRLGISQFSTDPAPLAKPVFLRPQETAMAAAAPEELGTLAKPVLHIAETSTESVSSTPSL